MKTTAIQSFNHTCHLIQKGGTHHFEGWKEMEKWVAEKGVRVEVVHRHPCGGVREEGGC